VAEVYPKVTIYRRGDFGYRRIEARNLEIDKSGTFYIPKGKRSTHQLSEAAAQRPSVVILDGWEHPVPPSGYTPISNGIQSSRYGLCDKRYDEEFDEFIEKYIAQSGAVVVADARKRTSTPLTDRPAREADNVTIEPQSLTFTVLTETESSVIAPLVEGLQTYDLVNSYERNPEARRQCLAHYGRICQVCETDLYSVYGEFGPRIIQVHHLRPLSAIGGEYEVDPIRDLVPVGPNCHSVLHQRTPPFTIDELRSMLFPNTQERPE
jgi:hypothetical protein